MIFPLRPLLLLALLCCLSACAPEEGPRPQIPSAESLTRASYVEGEILVRYREGAVVAAAAGGALLPGCSEREAIRLGGYRPHGATVAADGASAEIVIHRLQLPPGLNVPQALERLREHPGLLYAEPNYLVHRAAAIAPPDDPSFAKQWGLANSGQAVRGTSGTAGVDIDALTAWGVTTGDGSTVVAVIDSGIDYNHPDLKDNIWANPGESGLDGLGNDKATNGVDDDGNGKIDDVRGWDFVNNDSAPLDDDEDAHGTHVAGIIGARGNNAVGVAGVNWRVQLMPLKFLNSTGNGDIAKAATIINYAVSNGARVINASYEYSFGPSLTERDAIAAAAGAGVLLVAAAGNSGHNNDATAVYPASHPLDNILVVAATDANDFRASFSNYGATSVDLGAPGMNIYSTVRQNLCAAPGVFNGHICDDQPGYAFMNGTSMAAPLVSGAAALVWNRYPALTYQEVRDILLATVDPVPALTGFTVSGGRLNLGAALTVDLTQAPPAAPTALVVGSVAGGTVTLAWQDNSTIETGYVVERSPDGSNFTALPRLAANATAYTDSAAPDARRVYYRVKAVASLRSSAFSNQVYADVPLAEPRNVGVVVSKTGIALSWSSVSTAASACLIERKASNEAGFTQVAQVASATTSYLDSAAVTGVLYAYRLRSFDQAQNLYSGYTAEVVATRPKAASASGCFIATAAWGSPLAAEVASLRAFRDRVLLASEAGRLFVAAYYRLSPPVADVIADHEGVRTAMRVLLRPLVWLAQLVTPGEAAAMASRPAKTTAEESGVVAGEVLVGLRTGTSPAAVDALVAAEGGQLIEQIKLAERTVLHIRLPAGVAVGDAVARYGKHPEVQYAEPNRTVGLVRPQRDDAGGKVPQP